MAHETTVFEREALYAEVWKEPVRTVAERYGISDVALRKICQRLGVPVPPLGYWARVAAGQQPRVTPLPDNHKGDTRYVRSTYSDPERAEREERIAAILGQHPAPSEACPALKASVDACLAVVKRTAKALGPRSRNERRLLQAHGPESFEVTVSEEQRDRALLILDAAITAAMSAGAVLLKAAEQGKRPRLELLGVPFEIGLHEATERSERPLTAQELKEQKAGTLYYIPDRWAYSPTGALTLVVDPQAFLVTAFSISDGAREPLEKRLGRLASRMLAKAAEAKVRQEMSEEDNRRWQAEAARREVQERRKAAALARLETAESNASAWRRAQELREWASALESEAASRVVAGDPPDTEKVTAEANWIRRAADWLDPLVQGRMPLADGPAEKDDEDVGEDT
jgi:hypothetical protein